MKPRKLVAWKLKNPDVQVYGHEPIVLNDEYIGYLTSATYGHTLGGGVGLGYATRKDGSVTKKWLESNTFMLQVGLDMHEVVPSLAPHFDPKSLRVQGNYEDATPSVVVVGQVDSEKDADLPGTVSSSV